MAKQNSPNRLDALVSGWRGNAPKATNNSRELAKYIATGRCPTRGLFLAAGVSTDRLLKGTRYEVEFGQSPFAIQRGKKVEETAEKDDAEQIRVRAEAEFGAYTHWQVLNLREVRLKAGWEEAARETRDAVERVLHKDSSAPTLILGAAFAYRLKQGIQFYEADGLLVSPSGMIYVIEIKSFAKVGNQMDADALGEALTQASIYVVALRELVNQVGGSPQSAVSDEVLIYTPKNFRLQLAATRKNVRRRSRYIGEALDSIPAPADYVDSVPPGFSFATVSNVKLEEHERMEPLMEMTDRVGTCFSPACLGNCGLFRFCRERMYLRHSLAVLGPEVTNLLPGLETWDEALEISSGSNKRLPSHMELVGERLARALQAIEDAHGPAGIITGRVR